MPDASSLDLAVVGLNHKTAPLDVRERASVRPEELPAILGHLRRHAHEALLLSTCNRTEVYLAGVTGDPLSAFEGAWGQALGEHLYLYRGERAAQHLYRVAAGLDSLVVGETQIQGQVKRAWQDAHARGDTGALLNKVAQGALSAGKRVRTVTGIGDKATSVSGAAVDLARSVLGDLRDRHALVLGAGETAELTLTHLRAAGIGAVTVVNRSVERARLLAERHGGRVCAAELLHEALPEADVVIASSSAPHYVLGPERVEEALRQRPERPMFLIDISVPRIVDPAVGGVAGAYLYNLDDLTRLVEANLAERAALVPQAEAIIAGEIEGLLHWNAFREARRREALAVACD